MKKKLSTLLTIMVIALLGLVGCGKEEGSAKAESSATAEWPTKAVEVLVTAGAGGDTDFNARTFAKYFKKYTGKPMVISNVKGSNGMIAINQVKNSPTDGYKMIFGHTGQMIINEVSGNNNGENYLETLQVAAIPAIDKGTVLVANPKSGFKNIQEMVKMAKQDPESIVYGTELGGYSHLQGIMLQENAGMKLKFVDVGSTSDKITALLGDRIDLAAITYGSVADYIKTGELLAIGQFNEKRNENLDADIPTIKEAGIDFAMEKPYITVFPKGTDQTIIDKMNEVVEKVANDPDYKKDLYTAYKQPVEYLLQKDAMGRLNETRENFMKFQGLLKK